MKASAKACANIALVKYWGKRDETLHLPANSSLSMTAGGLETVTTVEFGADQTEDTLELDGTIMLADSREASETLGRFMGLVRELSGSKLKVRIASRNAFPTAAGLASSASGYAALAVALNGALDLGLDSRDLSILARRGSGSASRSIFGGFAQWHRGSRDDGADSFAEPVAPPEHWSELRMVVCVADPSQKKVKSRAGMSATAATSPLFDAWVASTGEDLVRVRQAVLSRDLSALGETAEANCLGMHATMLSARPALLYWTGETVDILHAVRSWREDGLEAYFTIDAGPQVKILCLEKDLDQVVSRLLARREETEILTTHPGNGAHLTDEHLF